MCATRSRIGSYGRREVLDAAGGESVTARAVATGRDRDGRDTAIVWGAVAAGFVLMELLRAWMPTLVVVLGEGMGTGPIGLAGVALGTLAVAPLAAILIPRMPARLVWLLGGTLLLGARLTLLLVTSGGRPQLVVTTVGVLGGAVAVVGLAAGSVRGDLARLGLLGGAALSAAVLAVLGSVDLVWRSGAVGMLGSLTVIAISAPPIMRATRALDGGHAAAAWPWGALGPALVLLGTVAAPAGRVAVATDWAPGRVAATTVGLMGLVIIGALLAARAGPLVAGTTGAVLVLVGTAAALDADGMSAVAGQAALAAGLGLCVVSGLRGGGTSPRRRGTVAGASLLLLGALTFAAYAGSLVPVPFGVHTVMLVSASLLASSALVSTVRGARLGREAPSSLLIRLTTGTLLGAFVLAGPAALRAPADPGPVSEDGTLTIVLANVHYGYDVSGRQRALEVGALLADLNADIVALNEVDRGWLITGTPDLLSTYAVATGLTPVFGPATDEVWGNAVLTRLPILEVQRTRLPRGRDPLARSVLTVVVELPDGSPLAIVVTHLSNVDRQGDTRLAQAQGVAAIVARLRERGIPALVAGDLNARPGDPELQVLEDLGLTRALPEARWTYPDTAPRVQIDHVLLPSGTGLVRAGTLATGLSDHRFVTAVIRTPGSIASGTDAANDDG
jgi:endonuclease/exonuclease/phosphatase family metal-dependent hydrolase